MSSEQQSFDLLCLGRLGVDLYGEQEGTPLSAIETFAKYVGGSAANVCVGVARLGLTTAMCSRVGDEGLGEFVLDTLARERIDTALVQRDPLHPTGVVALALYKRESFPRIFFYTDSADLSFDQEQLDWEVVDRADAVLLTGSYLVKDSLVTCSLAVANSVRERGGRVVLDVDFRPVLWGLVPVGNGNDMETSSAYVTEIYQKVLPLCDLVVGTEEEIAVAGGTIDISEALDNIRSLTDATIVLKRGADGASVYDGPIPENLEDGIGAPGYVVDVLNNTGAGDAFLSGFLSRWLRNQAFDECVQSGNASGAIVVTRNGCTPAMPFADEQTHFMTKGGIWRPDEDEQMERLHRIGSRRPTVSWRSLVSLEELDLHALIARSGGSSNRIDALRALLCEAIFQLPTDQFAIGILTDSSVGREILEEAVAQEIFVARSIPIGREHPKGRDDEEFSIALRTWHRDIVPAARADIDPHRSEIEIEHQWRRLAHLSRTCRLMEREMLIELCSPPRTKLTGAEVSRSLIEIYRAGAHPEYWMLPQLSDPTGRDEIAGLISEGDPSCRGYFIRPDTVGPAARGEQPAQEEGDSARRGTVQLDACDPFVLNAWLIGSLNNAEFVDALRIGLREKILASRDARS